MRTPTSCLIVVLVAAGSLARVDAAQKDDDNPLAGIKELRCTFPAHAGAAWTDGVAAAEVQRGAPMSVQVTDVDMDSATALLGGAHAVAVLAANALHFIERTMLGNLTVVTVFSRRDEMGRFLAVRSRHDYIPVAVPGFVSEPTVSQHYGVCAVPAAGGGP